MSTGGAESTRTRSWNAPLCLSAQQSANVNDASVRATARQSPRTPPSNAPSQDSACARSESTLANDGLPQTRTQAAPPTHSTQHTAHQAEVHSSIGTQASTTNTMASRIQLLLLLALAAGTGGAYRRPTVRAATRAASSMRSTICAAGRAAPELKPPVLIVSRATVLGAAVARGGSGACVRWQRAEAVGILWSH